MVVIIYGYFLPRMCKALYVAPDLGVFFLSLYSFYHLDIA